MSLSHLTALSAQTLSQALELQRFSTLPGSPTLPASLITQITRNMGSLRIGILDMEADTQGREEVRPLREQWERMRKMVEGQASIERCAPTSFHLCADAKMHCVNVLRIPHSVFLLCVNPHPRCLLPPLPSKERHPTTGYIDPTRMSQLPTKIMNQRMMRFCCSSDK
jgi:hypothetical protein